MPNRITQSDWLNILVFVGKAGQSRREADRPSSKLRCCSICDDRPSKQRQRWGVGHHAAASKNLTSTANAQGPVSVKQVRGVCELATHHHPSNLTLFQLDHHHLHPLFCCTTHQVSPCGRHHGQPEYPNVDQPAGRLPPCLLLSHPLALCCSLTRPREEEDPPKTTRTRPNPPQLAPTPNTQHNHSTKSRSLRALAPSLPIGGPH